MHVDESARDKAVSAFTTWEMSFQSLCRQGREYREAVAHFLTLSAYLAPIAVSESLFRYHWRRTNNSPHWTHMFTTVTQPDSDSDGFHSDEEPDIDNPGLCQCARLRTHTPTYS